ncbi:MAG: SDR family oxidoreductase [Desulfobacteraceae bacterium]|jgi:NAD(P)-dependent dehydrogenase (short-subunit alcohol dehydrogenase family)
MKKFPKKRIMITGAGSGLGRAIAMEFATLGWNICASDINLERADETVAMVKKNGGDGFAVFCDVTKPEQLDALGETLVKQWGGVDIVVNNAGVAAAGYMEKIPLETWDWIIDINLKSVIYGCRTFIPILAKQGRGHIVNVASNAGIASLPEMSCYNVTKAAVISLSETLRSELKPKNIGVSVIAPTFFKTNLMDQFKSSDDRQKKMANAFFAKSKTTSQDIARHVVKVVVKDKLYAITQMDGKFTWLSKRLTPEFYFNIMGWGYKRGLGDKFLGM